MAESVKTLSVYINLKTKAFSTGLGRLSRTLKRFGSKLKATGARLTSSITMPLALAGGASIKLATDFEASMTKITTLVGTSAGEVEKLKSSVLDLAGKTAQAPKDLADALFFIQSAGFKGQESLDILEMSAKGAAMGMGELTDIANASTSIMTGWAKEGMTAQRATDLLHETLKQGKFEAADFMSKIGQVIPTAASFGISFEQLGASVATMSKLSGDAAGSLTAVNKLMMGLSAPAEQQLDILNDMFGSYENLSKSLKGDFMGTLKKIFTELEGQDQQLVKVFGSTRAVKAAFATAGLQGETYAEVLDGMNESAGNVNEGFAEVSETSMFKFNKALAELKVAAIEMGAAIMPMATKMANWIGGLAKSFSNMSEQGKKTTLMIGGILLVAGPLLTLIGGLISVGGTLIGVLSGIAGALFAIEWPVLLIILAIAALITAMGLITYNIVKDWDKAKTKITEFVNSIIKLYNETLWVKIGIESVIFMFKDFWAKGKFAINSIGDMFGYLGQILTNLFDKEARQEAWKKLTSSLLDNWEDTANQMQENMDTAIDNIQNREFEMITEDDVQEFVDKGKEMGENLWDGMKKGVEKGKEWLSGFMFGGGGGGGGTDPAPADDDVEDEGFAMTEQEILDLQKALNEGFEEAKKPVIEWSHAVLNQWKDTYNSMQETLSGFGLSYAESFAGMVATTITEGGNLAQAFGSFIKQMLIDLAAMLIKMAVFKALMAALGMPTGGLAGGGGKGILSLFGMAEGGLAFGPTPVMVGEGRGTSITNPEVIAPLDKIRGMIGGGGTGRLHGEISGSNILLSNDRSTTTQDRVSGSVSDF